LRARSATISNRQGAARLLRISYADSESRAQGRSGLTLGSPAASVRPASNRIALAHAQRRARRRQSVSDRHELEPVRRRHHHVRHDARVERALKARELATQRAQRPRRGLPIKASRERARGRSTLFRFREDRSVHRFLNVGFVQTVRPIDERIRRVRRELRVLRAHAVLCGMIAERDVAR
jgi:hypothetical protein